MPSWRPMALKSSSPACAIPAHSERAVAKAATASGLVNFPKHMLIVSNVNSRSEADLKRNIRALLSRGIAGRSIEDLAEVEIRCNHRHGLDRRPGDKQVPGGLFIVQGEIVRFRTNLAADGHFSVD